MISGRTNLRSARLGKSQRGKRRTGKRFFLSFVGAAALLIFTGACPPAAGAEDNPPRPGQERSADAWAVFQRALNPPALTPEAKQHIEKLLRDLGDDNWKVREKATEELSRLGPKAIPLIQPAAQSKDAEVSLRANLILKTLQAKVGDAGAELNAAIDALAAARDKKLVASLIGLLEHANLSVRYAAEYGLRRTIGKCFGYNSYDDPPKQAQAAEKWRQWWKQNEADFAFETVKAGQEPAGILICDSQGRKLVAVTFAGKVAWSHKFPQQFFSAAGLPNGNIIVAYSGGQRNVEEYDRNFRPVWNCDKLNLSGMVYDVHRLPNGNTLIAYVGAKHVTEVSPAGQIVWQMKNLRSPGAAVRLPNGNTLISENHGNRVIEVNHDCKVVWQKTDLRNPSDAAKLPNGNVLIAEYLRKRVIEVDRAGKIVWERKCPAYPSSALRLPDGTTAISNKTEGVILVGRSGKKIRQLYKHNSCYGKIRLIPAAVLKQK